MNANDGDTGQFIVSGRITQSDGRTLSNATVRAFNKDLPSLGRRSEQQLGRDVNTDNDGCYKILWTERDFLDGEARMHGKVRPDIFIRILEGDTLLGESNVHFNADREEHIDLTVTRPDRSEYENLISQIMPVLQGVAIADLTDEDIVFLKGETGIGQGRLYSPKGLAGPVNARTASSADLLVLLRKAAQFARQADGFAEACYGWVRLLNSPDIDHLAALPEADLRFGPGSKRSSPRALQTRSTPPFARSSDTTTCHSGRRDN
jgi:hypothetical protein